MARELVVFGSRVRDVTVDVDLPDLYRDDPTLREQIRFHGNDPIIREDTRIAVQIGARSLVFPMRLKVPADAGRQQELIHESDHVRYYRLRGGWKYDLEAPAKWMDGAPALSMALPCRKHAWGGGGINLITAVRGMSSSSTTPITYLDTARTLLEKKWYQDLWETFTREQEGGAPAVLKDLQLIREVVDFAVSIPSDVALRTEDDKRSAFMKRVEELLGPHLEQTGERSYRRLAQLLRVFDPMESIDIALTRLGIRFAMVRGVPHPAPLNLVFAHIREATRLINDKIIFRGKRDAIDDAFEGRAAQLFEGEVADPGLIVINTVYDSPMFRAAIRWAMDTQKRQMESRDEWEVCPVLLVLTRKNVQHMDVQEFEKLYTEFKNLYVLFNETEFGEYLAEGDPEGASKFVKTIEDGLLPEMEDLQHLLRLYDTVIKDKTQQFIVTFGPLGSLGVTRDRVIHVGSYAARERTVQDTSGCGDAYAGGIALLVYHKHNHDGQSGIPPAQLLPDADEEDDFTLMMQVGAAAAYSRATDPASQVSRRVVVSLLENEYLPTMEPRSLGRFGKGNLPRPRQAIRVGLPGLLKTILTG